MKVDESRNDSILVTSTSKEPDSTEIIVDSYNDFLPVILPDISEEKDPKRWITQRVRDEIAQILDKMAIGEDSPEDQFILDELTRLIKSCDSKIFNRVIKSFLQYGQVGTARRISENTRVSKGNVSTMLTRLYERGLVYKKKMKEFDNLEFGNKKVTLSNNSLNKYNRNTTIYFTYKSLMRVFTDIMPLYGIIPKVIEIVTEEIEIYQCEKCGQTYDTEPTKCYKCTGPKPQKLDIFESYKQCPTCNEKYSAKGSRLYCAKPDCEVVVVVKPKRKIITRKTTQEYTIRK